MIHRNKLTRLCAYATACLFLHLVFFGPACGAGYVLPDIGQTKCYGNSGEISCPSLDHPFYGQDGNYQGPQPAYQLSADGLTVKDLNTGLMGPSMQALIAPERLPPGSFQGRFFTPPMPGDV